MGKQPECTMRELQDGDRVPFVWKTDNLGRAEFQICVQWRRGKISDVWIYPRQQENITENYHIKVGHSDRIRVGSWIHKGMEVPNIWLTTWCKEHKCSSIHVYVPDNSKSFEVRLLSTLGIEFDNER